MRIRKVAGTALVLGVLAFCGCSTEGGSETSSYDFSSFSEKISDAPFDIISGPPMPDTPYLEYLGCVDIENSDAFRLYAKNYAGGSSGKVISCENVTPANLAARLSERISADLSPDLCDKLDNSYPYLMSKNSYEDLTTYIDITAPQWEKYSGYIIGCEINGARYFYPTNITVSPNYLIYSKNRMANLGLEDPREMWENGEWTRSKFSGILTKAPYIGGQSVLENLLASSGISIVTANESGKFVSKIGDESFLKNAEFVNKNYIDVSDNADGGIDALISGKCAFLSINDGDLAKIRSDYPNINLGIVPFPCDDNADGYYYNAVSDGFLVPKHAKNIKGAACFINCSRISAENAGQTALQSGLLPDDVELLNKLRSSDDTLFAVSTRFCLDDEGNSSLRELTYKIYDGSDDPEELVRSYTPAIARSVVNINANID